MKNLTNCRTCKSENLKKVEKYEHENFEGETIYTNGILCLDCETFHYMEDDRFCYEFIPECLKRLLDDSFKPVQNYVTDYQKNLEKVGKEA